MRNPLRFFLSIIVCYSSTSFGADISNPIFLTTDIWVHVFNFLPLKNQYFLGLTCTQLNGVFNNQLVCAHDINATNFDKENSLINKFKNLFAPQRVNDANAQCQSFCRKIATNQLGGAITFAGTSNQFILFCESLKTNNCITQLTIPDIGLTDNGITLLASSLAVANNSSFKSLIVRKNICVTYIGVANLLQKLPQLEELDVSENFLPFFYNEAPLNARYVTNEELKCLNPVLGNLKKLHMNECGFTAKTIDWIIDFLKTNTKLEELYLANNYIYANNRPTNLVQAADTENNSLKILDLSENGFKILIPHYDIKRKDLKVII